MGSRGLSRQMEQAGGSRGATGRDPSPSSNLGNGAWDLGAVCGARGPQSSSQREPETGKPGWSRRGQVPARVCPVSNGPGGKDGVNRQDGAPCPEPGTDAHGNPPPRPPAARGGVPPGATDLSRPQGDPFYYLPRAAGTIRRGLPWGGRWLLEDSSSELASASLQHPPDFPVPPSTAWQPQPRAASPGAGLQAPVPPPGPATYQLFLLLPMKLCFLSLGRNWGEKKSQKCYLEGNPDFYLHPGFQAPPSSLCRPSPHPQVSGPKTRLFAKPVTKGND